MENKEKPISPYNGSGHLDLTPYYAVLNIVIKEQTVTEKCKKTTKKSSLALEFTGFIELHRNCD